MKIIVNVNKDMGIGRDGELLVNIPEDMKFFRHETAGSVLIMGRKTLESFPGARPLKGRINIVLTRVPHRISQASRSGANGFFVYGSGTGYDKVLDPYEPPGFDKTQDSDRALDSGKYLDPDKNLDPGRATAEPEIIGRHAKDIGSAGADEYDKTGGSDCSMEFPFNEIRRVAAENLEKASAGIKASELRTILITVGTREDVLSIIRRICPDGTDNVFVIGGASVYELFLDDCDTCLVTENDSERAADTFFPDIMSRGWHCAIKGERQQYERISYSFNTYVKDVEI